MLEVRWHVCRCNTFMILTYTMFSCDLLSAKFTRCHSWWADSDRLTTNVEPGRLHCEDIVVKATLVRHLSRICVKCWNKKNIKSAMSSFSARGMTSSLNAAAALSCQITLMSYVRLLIAWPGHYYYYHRKEGIEKGKSFHCYKWPSDRGGGKSAFEGRFDAVFNGSVRFNWFTGLIWKDGKLLPFPSLIHK